MLAYSMQELLVEPFAGLVFALPPDVTTKLAGVQHGGVLVGMILVAGIASGIGGRRLGSLKGWTILGCLASACALIGLAFSGFGGDPLQLRIGVGALGFSNGVFAVAAIGSMMGLASSGARGREGARMGLWGAAQAIAFAARRPDRHGSGGRGARGGRFAAARLCACVRDRGGGVRRRGGDGAPDGEHRPDGAICGIVGARGAGWGAAGAKLEGANHER